MQQLSSCRLYEGPRLYATKLALYPYQHQLIKIQCLFVCSVTSLFSCIELTPRLVIFLPFSILLFFLTLTSDRNVGAFERDTFFSASVRISVLTFSSVVSTSRSNVLTSGSSDQFTPKLSLFLFAPFRPIFIISREYFLKKNKKSKCYAWTGVRICVI